MKAKVIWWKWNWRNPVRKLTGTEDAQLLGGRHDVEMRGEEVHEGAGVHHEHEHAEAVHAHLLPVGTRGSLSNVDAKNGIDFWHIWDANKLLTYEMPRMSFKVQNFG